MNILWYSNGNENEGKIFRERYTRHPHRCGSDFVQVFLFGGAALTVDFLATTV